jgi:hypothetical protein
MREKRPLAVDTGLSAEDVLAVDALLRTVHELTGMDFRDYARAALCRRVQRALLENSVSSVAALDARIREDRRRAGACQRNAHAVRDFHVS